MNLSKNVKIGEVLLPVAASDSIDSNSDILDMSGFEGVVFVAVITDSVATGVATLTAQGSTANSDGAMAGLTGAAATATCVVNDDLNDKILIVDVYRPTKRYIQATLTSATANIAYGNTIAIQYGPREKPITDAASVSQSTAVQSPA